MISVAEADSLLARFSEPWPSESVPLHVAVGRILREDIRADRPYPAQDRSRMDGIAVAFSDWEKSAREFPIAGMARAGDPRTSLPKRGLCIEIMTGAAIPEGADTVIPYEDVEISDAVARVRDGVVVKSRQFVHARGTDCAAGDVLVPAGVRLQAAHIAVAASVGASRLSVARLPRVAVISTGDELVDVSATPADHQLRASNDAALAALLVPWVEVSTRSCSDDPATLAATLAEALNGNDLLLISGGVSAGKFDLVPETLAALGVEKIFHKIAQKPGKPLWFGSKTQSPLTPQRGEDSLLTGEKRGSDISPHWGAGGATLVFGLPGNPVSSLVCARRYVLPLLWAKAGWSRPPVLSARLAAPVKTSRLTQFVPVRLEENDGMRRADPSAVNGSGDFANLGASDGFVEVPPLDNARETGESLSFYAWFP